MNFYFESEHAAQLYNYFLNMGGSLGFDNVTEDFVISENLMYEYIYFIASVKGLIHSYIVKL